MANYKLKRLDKRFLKALQHFFHLNPEELTEENLNEMNNSPIERKYEKKYLLKSGNNIYFNSHVIPVNDGAITGYYFQNQNVIEESGMTPLTIFYHGGGWVYGNMSFYSIFMKHLADVTGTSILLTDYRLAPKYKFPVAVEDCYDTLLWAVNGAKYWKVDPDRIFVAGDGAGANLAAVVSILARDRKGPNIAGQILIYPIVDGRLRTQSMDTHKDNPALSKKMLAFYISNYQREPKDILSPLFSPLLSQDLTRLPNALIISAEYDPLKDDAALYTKALEEAEVKVKHLMVEKAFNGFMPFKHGRGRKEVEGALYQFINGRSLENIILLEKKKLNKSKHHKAEKRKEEKSEVKKDE